ncbi:hypothetical protein [Nonomuraea insulae]|uniref:Uncharacterized protein n=1 Tax=Nonomuraea insulae TaxID=1616787 RepID=A0ABW1CS24_9ACTN
MATVGVVQRNGPDPFTPGFSRRRVCPEPLAAAVTSTEFDQLIRDSHDEALNEVGLDVGTPVLRIGGMVMFDPVITPAPCGEAAGRPGHGRQDRTASSSSTEP